jgi:cell division septation protein DedD
MEDQGTWKGHSFTLIVFIGIVILCSIFFTLGMVVGRNQAQNPTSKSGTSDTHAPQQNEKKDETSISPNNDSLKDTTIVVERAPETKPDPPPAKPVTKVKESAAPPPAPVADPPPAKSSSGKMIYVQVSALAQSAAANKQADELRRNKFHVLVQSGDGPDKLHHVLVGPFSNAADADIAKRKLEALGYKQLLLK